MPHRSPSGVAPGDSLTKQGGALRNVAAILRRSHAYGLAGGALLASESQPDTPPGVLAQADEFS